MTNSRRPPQRRGKNYIATSYAACGARSSGRYDTSDLLAGQQCFQFALLESLVRADGDAIDPSPKLRQRNAVRRRWMPHLDLEPGARRDRIRPAVLLQ